MPLHVGVGAFVAAVNSYGCKNCFWGILAPEAWQFVCGICMAFDNLHACWPTTRETCVMLLRFLWCGQWNFVCVAPGCGNPTHSAQPVTLKEVTALAKTSAGVAINFSFLRITTARPCSGLERWMERCKDRYDVYVASHTYHGSRYRMRFGGRTCPQKYSQLWQSVQVKDYSSIKAERERVVCRAKL